MTRQPHQLARTSDPDTSHAAAHQLDGTAIRAALLAALQVLGPMTADEVTEAAGAPPGAWKRVSDLKNDGLVLDTGARRPGRSGRAQIVWAAYEPLDW